jgi:hypothetical protein
MDMCYVSKEIIAIHTVFKSVALTIVFTIQVVIIAWNVAILVLAFIRGTGTVSVYRRGQIFTFTALTGRNYIINPLWSNFTGCIFSFTTNIFFTEEFVVGHSSLCFCSADHVEMRFVHTERA